MKMGSISTAAAARRRNELYGGHHHHHHHHIIVLVLLMMMMMSRRVSALSVAVVDVECVYEYVQYDHDTISGNFVVVDHEIFWGFEHPGIDFTVTGPGGSVVLALKGTSGDKFEFRAPRSGMYKFCFNNPNAAPESVSFYIHVGHIPSENDLAKDEHLDPINVKIAELRESLASVTSEQKYLKARDARHRNTNESTRNRVIYYTIAEYVLFAMASGLQVFYIRKLFNKTVGYNRV